MSLTSYRAAPPRAEEKGSSEWRIDIGLLGIRYSPRIHRKEESFVLCRPGDDLLSQVLRHSTIGAEAFDGRVRDGIGSDRFAEATRPAKDKNEANCAFGQVDIGQIDSRSCDCPLPICRLPVDGLSFRAILIWMGID